MSADSSSSRSEPSAPSAPWPWTLVPHLLLRRAGFSFDLLLTLACPETASLVNEAVAVMAKADACRTQLLRDLFPQAVRAAAAKNDRAALKALSRWRRALGARRVKPVPSVAVLPSLREAALQWQTLSETAAALLGRAQSTFLAEDLALRQRLWNVARRADVQEALFLLSPDFFRSFSKALSKQGSVDVPADDRALDRRLYAFLQRLASKNETTSFFGPMTHAKVSTETPEANCSTPGYQFGAETPSGTLRRETFTAFWAVCALGRAASVDPLLRDHLPVRRIPASSVQPGNDAGAATAWGVDGAPVTLESTAMRVLAHVDDQRTVGALAATAQLSVSTVEQSIRQLEKAGFVRRDLEPLSTTPYPLEDLDRQLAAIPHSGRWREAIAQFKTLQQRFESASADARPKALEAAETFFQTVTGKQGRRGQGQMYADRTLFYEDCAGDLQPVRMTSPEAARVASLLSPVLELGAAYGLRRHQALSSLAVEVLRALGGRATYLHFSRALEARVQAGELSARMEPAKAFLRTLETRVTQAIDSHGHCARLTSEDIQDFCTEAAPGRFASPDFILWNERSGEPPRLVIGEVHPYVFAWGSQGQFAPHPEALQAAFRADLSPWGGDSQIATVLRRRRHKGLVTDAFPGTFVEVTGRALMGDARRVAISALTVETNEHGVQLASPQGPLRLYVGEDDHPHLRCFAPPLVEMPPIRLGTHTPRIEVNGVVLQRERWDLLPEHLEPLARATPGLERFFATAQARLAHGWPRFVFLGAPSEPKPMCVDLESPLAQAHFQRLVRLGRVSIVEMLPPPEGLHLRRHAGAFTSEWRVGMVRRA